MTKSPNDKEHVPASESEASLVDKLALAQRLATRRLAVGVLPELDACFAALALRSVHEPTSETA